MNESEVIADFVSLLAQQPPPPHEYSTMSFRQSCFVNRVDQVDEICRAKDIRDARLLVFTEYDKVKELQDADRFFSTPCSVIGSEQSDYYETFQVILISESLEIADHVCMGILYEEPVSATEWETRWVLQLNDLMHPRDAIKAAKKL